MVTHERRLAGAGDQALLGSGNHFLAEAGALLSSSLDYEITLARVAELAVPHVADWCTVHLVDDRGTVEQVALAHVDPSRIEWARELGRRYPPDMRAPQGLAQVIRSGTAELYPEITDEVLVATARDEEHLQLMRQIGFTSALIVPMIARGRTIGAMTMVSTELGYRYSEEDLKRCEQLARWAAVAVDNAHLYREAQVSLSERSRLLAEVELRARQQEVVAELAQRALSCTDLRKLMQEATDLVARTLGTTHSAVWELVEHGGALRLSAVSGWPGEAVGRMIDLGRTDFVAGYTLASGGPVVVNDYATERRFAPWPWPHGQPVTSGMSLIIHGQSGPFGVLGTHSTARREFTQGEQNFLQSVADVLAMAIQRAEADRARAESEERFRLLVESVTDYAIFILDQEGRIASWNSGVERLMGYRADQIIGCDIAAFFPGEDAAEASAVELSRALAHGRAETEGWRLRSDGSRFWAHVVTRPLFHPGGRHRGYSKVLQDISERKRAAEQIQALNADLERRVLERTEELEAANRELEAFSYSVSHDLRGPLRTVDGFSQALLEDYADRLDADGVGMLSRVRNATQRMSQLIDDLLQLARVSRGELIRGTVSMTQLARSIAAELGRSAPERHVTWTIADGVDVQGDERLLHLVLVNLLGNAWKFTSKQPVATITFGVTRIGPEKAYFVRDNGAGFDMAYAGKLFGPFQRLHGVTEFPGTGIGLATVQRIIRRHGGRVWGEGAEGKGATFYFTLP